MASGTGQYSIPAFRGVRPSGHAAASPVKVIQAYRFALDASPALRDFDKSRKGLRKGKRLGFPKVKKRGKCRDSFRFGGGAIRCAGTTVILPRLGTIRTHESTRKLGRRLTNGTARILSATVSRTA